MKANRTLTDRGRSALKQMHFALSTLKILSSLLAFILCVSCLPSQVFAQVGSDAGSQTAGLSDDPAATATDPSSGSQGTADDSTDAPASTAGSQEASENSASSPGFSDASQQAPENAAGGSDAVVSPGENASVGAGATESASTTVGAGAAAGARAVTEASTVAESSAAAGASIAAEGGAVAEASIVAGAESIAGIMPLSIGDHWDLSNYITGIVVRDSAGSAITNGSFFYNEPYSFAISFAEHEKTGGQFEYNSGKLVYQLPKELVVSSPQSGFIKVANGSSVGEYSIGSDGLVQLFFYNVDNQGNAIGQNFIDYYVNVKFSLVLQADFASDLTAGKIDFGANSSITVNSISSQAAALQVAKTASAYNSASESVSFTVEVRAVGGQVSNVVLADSLGFSIQNAFKIKSSDIPGNYANPFSSGSGSFEYSINGGAWVSQALPQWESGGQRLLFDFGTTGGITLQSNETVQLRYTVSLSDVLDYFASQSLPGPGDPGSWIQRYLYNLTLNNTATASGRDGGTELTSASTTQTPLRKTLLSKSGTEQADGQIQWTARVGDGLGDGSGGGSGSGSGSSGGSLVLNGLTINDSMNGGLSQTISGDLTIKLYGLSNNLLSTVTVSAPYIGTAGFALDGSNGFTYTVPASPANIGRVDFVYYTTPSDLSPNGIYRNEIGITVNGQTSSVSSSVSYSGLGTGVGTPENAFNIRYTKSSQWQFDSAGKPSDLIYTIVMRVPAGTDLIDSAAGVFQDVFMSYESGDGNYPYLHKDWRITGGAEANINNLVNVTVSGEASPDYCVYLPTTGSGADMRVYLGVSSVPSVVENYRWPYSEAKTVTITYRVPLDIPDLAGTTTLLEYLQSTPNARLRNQIISTGNGVEDVVVASCYDSYPMYKSVEPNYFMSSLFDYSVTLNGYTNVGQQSLYDSASGNQGYPLFAAGQAAIFTDTFDPKLSYVPGSLKVSDGTNYYGPYEMNGAYVQDWLAGQIVGNSFTVDFRDFVQVDGALSTIIDASPGDWYADSIEYTVYYQLLLKDQYTESYPDPAGPPLAVQNTATVFASSEHYSGGVFTDSAEALYTPQVVHKEMSTNNGDNTADVEIIINPDGKRLRPVSVADPLLTATDSMQGSLGFYLSTIRIETQNLVAGVWDGVWIAAPTPIAVGALWSFSPHDAQTVDFYIPDEHPVRITYTAAITEYYWGQPTDFSNSITVSGYSSSVSFEDYVISRSSAFAEADGDRTEVLLYKTDSADPGRLLPGARFALYLDNEYGWPHGRIPTDPSIPAVIEVPDTYDVLYYLEDQVVGPSGYIRFSDPWLTYSSNRTFVLIELEAPPGYQLPATLADRMSLFSFRAASPIGDKEFTVILDYLVISNDRIAPIDVQIPIEKIVTNQPTATETFTFRLAEVTDATGDTY
ncbi:MAG: hypothetical protein LBG68_00020, partial [Coriobacteriales bacterium]|nr:hypothetical protein [Coriobacteriales bacterium]